MKYLRHLSPNPLLLALVSIFLTSGVAATQPSVVTQLYDNQHTGWNPNETLLTVANVKSSFKLLFKDTTDSGIAAANRGTYAQPLYVPAVQIGGAAHNVIFVATEANNVYAFDADKAGAPLWSKNLTPSGETLQTSNDYANTRIPQIGISGTPVIDPVAGTLYVVAASKTTSGTTVFHQRLHALDITSGNERSNSPVDIAAKYPGTGSPNDGNGNVVFNPLVEFNRTALTLFGNTVYTAWSAHEDNGIESDGSIDGTGAYQGWIIAYDKTSLAQVGVFNTDPSIVSDPNLGSGGGSIWQASVGMVADDSSLYSLSANGPFNGGPNYGDTLLRLTQAPSIGVGDYFTPCDQYELYANDVDLGAGAPMVLPDQSSGPTKLLTFAGKEGSIYLINRTSLGHYTPTQNTPPQGPSTTQCTDNVVQVLWRVLGTASKTDSALGANRDAFWGAPAYFKDSSGRQYVYYTGDYSPIMEYDLASGALSPGNNPGGQPNQTPSSNYNFARGGTLPSISSNGGDTSTAILWAIRHPTPDVSSDGTGTIHLDAFPANDLTNEIVTDIPAGTWNYQNNAWIIPTVVNGKVYVSSSGELDVFGTSGTTSATPTATATSTSGATPTATATPVSTPTPGRLWVNRARMNFGRVKVGSTRQAFFRVGDVGRGVLHVTVSSLSAPFTIESNPGTLSFTRGQTSPKIFVQFAPTTTDLVQQNLTISSDDPKRPTFMIDVFGRGR
ncbi:MAG TPA: hypothetical protein VKV03_14550 [Candidatus Binataceae bacterium]|nr:hypothetical protein [Candidatus Binataceae bacterium]